MERIPASEGTREQLKALMEGKAEAEDALGRGYCARDAAPGTGDRNGCRPGRLKSAKGAIEYCAAC